MAHTTLNVLKFHNLNGHEAEFLTDRETYISSENITNNEERVGADDNSTLLTLAVKRNLVTKVKLLISKGAKVNNSEIKIADRELKFEILEQLLKAPTVQVSESEKISILKSLLQSLELSKRENDMIKFEKSERCFKAYLENPKFKADEANNILDTALNYALMFKNKEAQLIVLGKGAYIGRQNTIYHIDPVTLEHHLDNCIITEIRGSLPNSKYFKIEIDLINFLPVKSKAKTKFKFQEEMSPFIEISERNGLKHLMTHPVITSFLFIKWHRFFSLFLLNFIFYMVFCTSLVAYVVFFYGHNSDSYFHYIFVTLSLVGVAYLFLREVIQLILNGWKYFMIFENSLEIALIATTIMVLIDDGNIERTRFYAALTVLFAALELSLLISSWPNVFISTHIVMLKQVSWSFFRSLSVNSFLIVAFAFSFYTLIGRIKPNLNEESDFNDFASPQSAIIKTIVMMTGEFEAAAIKLDSYSSMIFLIFVFYMSIVLFNLLNGLAVSDIQKIKAEAEQCHFIEKAKTLNRFEKTILCNKYADHPLFKWIAENFICIFPSILTQYKIYVYPNQGNRIEVLFRRSKATSNETVTSVLIDDNNESDREEIQHLTTMDQKIINNLQHRIELRDQSSQKDAEKLALNKRMENMEATLNKLMQLMNN